MAPPTKMLKLSRHPKIASSTKSLQPAITFLDLPQEILNMIAILLDEEQLPALRLISKQARHGFSDIFAKVHFAHLRHHLTKPSLQDLIHITSHIVFSKYVKSIEFSTARTKHLSPESPTPLLGEDSEFRQAGHHITMLVTVLENLKHHGNHKVSLGVFDSFSYNDFGIFWPYDGSPWPAILGHGYNKSYGVGNVLEGVFPHGTMFAISEAAKLSGYSLTRLSITTAANSPTLTKLIEDDKATVLFNERSSQLMSNLMLRYIVVGRFGSRGRYNQAPCLTLEVHTGASSRLSLQGQTIALDQWIFARASRTGELFENLPSVFFDTRYQTLTLKDLQLNSQGLTSLCSRTMQQTFACLEISKVDVWVNRDFDDLGPITFLKHFKRHSNIKNFRISNLVVNANFYVTHSGDRELPQPLRLAIDEIVAENHDKVQSVFDDLIAQILTWREAIGRA